MKNVKQSQLRKSIVMTTDEFKEVFTNLFGEYNEDDNEVNVEFDTCDGIYFCGITDEEVYSALSEYFDAEITSIHIDHFINTGVWICYKENKLLKEIG